MNDGLRLTGFRAATVSLRDAGCRTLFLAGSFVTAKESPKVETET